MHDFYRRERFAAFRISAGIPWVNQMLLNTLGGALFKYLMGPETRSSSTMTIFCLSHGRLLGGTLKRVFQKQARPLVSGMLFSPSRVKLYPILGNRVTHESPPSKRTPSTVQGLMISRKPSLYNCRSDYLTPTLIGPCLSLDNSLFYR